MRLSSTPTVSWSAASKAVMSYPSTGRLAKSISVPGLCIPDGATDHRNAHGVTGQGKSTAVLLFFAASPHCQENYLTDIQSIAESVVAGQSDSANLSHWSLYFWNRGDFFHSVKVDGLNKAKNSSSVIRRYSGTQEVAHRVLYGAPGEAGCVEVRAPAEHDDYQGNFGDLLIPLHSHATDHIAIVLGGGGTFLIKRQINGDDAILMIQAGPGSIFFYPAGVPHTFISGKDGIHVASAQAEFESPASVRFADWAPEYLNDLPRIKQNDYLSGLSL